MEAEAEAEAGAQCGTRIWVIHNCISAQHRSSCHQVYILCTHLVNPNPQFRE